MFLDVFSSEASGYVRIPSGSSKHHPHSVGEGSRHPPSAPGAKPSFVECRGVCEYSRRKARGSNKTMEEHLELTCFFLHEFSSGVHVFFPTNPSTFSEGTWTLHSKPKHLLRRYLDPYIFSYWVHSFCHQGCVGMVPHSKSIPGCMGLPPFWGGGGKTLM